MNNIGSKIKRAREQKGYSQEFIASQLDVAQATYARMESQEIKLSIDRLQKIATILDVEVLSLLDSSKVTIQNQTNSEGGNGYVEILYIENKETLKKLIQTLESENKHLKTEVEFLRSIVTKNV